jgi:hypothetical protein
LFAVVSLLVLETCVTSDVIEIENMARLGRVTCGWKRPELSLDSVRPYWRDAHSPAIARRAGIYEYRHYPLDPPRAALFGALPGVQTRCDDAARLMWLSDVRYADQAGLDAFGASPGPEVKAQILADIEMIVDKSTTYLVLGDNGRTLVDTTDEAAPAGPRPRPTYQVFIRQRGGEAPFRAGLQALATRWAATPGVRRLRLSLFEVPDMEAERKAGYPVKTHPVDQQYQAWLDLALDTDDVARDLFNSQQAVEFAAFAATVHAYPTPAVYTFNYGGHPTLIGLRGYAALAAIRSLGAEHQKDPGLLEWMYGQVAKGVTVA